MFDAEKVTELIAEARALATDANRLMETKRFGTMIADLADALSSLRDAEPEALTEIRAMHKPKKGQTLRGFQHDDRESGDPVWEDYMICDYDKTPWPCRHAIILGLPVPEGADRG